MANARTAAKYAEILLKARLVDELQLKSAMAHVARWGQNLPHAVAELGFAEEDAILDALAKALKLPAVHLGNVLKDNGALRALGAEFCEKNAVFPVSLKERVLTLAMADPTDVGVVDEAGSMARARVKVVMSSETEIRAAIAKNFRGQESAPRRKVSGIRGQGVAPAEPPLELDTAPPPKPSPPRGAPRFGPEELQRLNAVAANQQKVGHILRTVQELLELKGLLPRS